MTKQSMNFTNIANYFKQKLDLSSDYRMQFFRGKQRVNYILTDETKKARLSKLSTPLGYLSFSIYYTRLLANLSLLCYQLINNEEEKKFTKIQPIFYQIFNDLLWGSINFVEFFFWSFNKSVTAGRMGMKLEVMGLLIDLTIMIIRSNQNLENLKSKLSDEQDNETKQKLCIHIQTTKKNQIRIILHLLTIALSLSTIAFPLGFSIPLSPAFFLTGMISGYLRLKWTIEKERAKSIVDNKTPEHQSINLQFIDYLNRNIMFPLAIYLALSTFSVGFSIIFFSVLLSNDLIPAVNEKFKSIVDTVLDDTLLNTF